MISIKDIAEKAGVSRGTVDRVLHNRGRVSAETEALIRRTAKELGYVPGEAGQALAAHKKKLTLGYVCLHAEWAPFFVKVLDAAREEAKRLEQYGVTTVFKTLALRPGEDLHHEISEIRDLIADDRRMDGWVVLGSLAKYVLPETGEKDREIPVVLYNMDEALAPPYRKLGVVSCDYEHSGRIAGGLSARLTGEEGSILLITCDDGSISSSSLRMKGLKAELQERYPKLKVVAEVTEPDHYGGPQVTIRAMEALKAHPDTAVIYIANPGNYSICSALTKTAKELGIRPQIITNDLISEDQADMLRRGIISATICQEPEKQGARPLQMLYEYLAYGTIPDPAWDKTKLEILIGQSLA